MKVSLKVTGQRDGFQYGVRKNEPYTVVEVEDVTFTDNLTANFLRAVADEIDPPAIEYAEVQA